jgi:hypothetical protein
MSRKVIVEQLKDYFATKGGVMTAEQYKDAPDAPIRIQVLKRKLGSWPRIMNMLDMKAPEVIVAPAIEAPVIEAPAIEAPAIEAPEPAVEPEPIKPALKTKGA